MYHQHFGYSYSRPRTDGYARSSLIYLYIYVHECEVACVTVLTRVCSWCPSPLFFPSLPPRPASISLRFDSSLCRPNTIVERDSNKNHPLLYSLYIYHIILLYISARLYRIDMYQPSDSATHRCHAHPTFSISISLFLFLSPFLSFRFYPSILMLCVLCLRRLTVDSVLSTRIQFYPWDTQRLYIWLAESLITGDQASALSPLPTTSPVCVVKACGIELAPRGVPSRRIDSFFFILLSPFNVYINLSRADSTTGLSYELTMPSPQDSSFSSRPRKVHYVAVFASFHQNIANGL